MFDFMASLALEDDGFKKLILKRLNEEMFPIEADVVSRLA